MRIVLDTNIVISAVFFGGNPRTIVEAVVERKAEAYATTAIVEEYHQIVHEMIARKKGTLSADILMPLEASLKMIETSTDIAVCRDPDDDKFIECAVDANASYIVSGDRDLLDIGSCEGIPILTAKEFCEQYLF